MVFYSQIDALFYDLTRDSIANNFVIGFYCRCLEITKLLAIDQLDTATVWINLRAFYSEIYQPLQQCLMYIAHK